MMFRSFIVAFLPCLLVFGGQGLAAPCDIRPLGVAVLNDTSGFLSSPVLVEGQAGSASTSMIVDTGSEGSLIAPSLVHYLNLISDPQLRTIVRGTGGGANVMPNVIVPHLVVGSFHIGPLSIPSGVLPSWPRITPPIGGLIGGDILAQHDLWFDPVSGTFSFLESGRACGAMGPGNGWSSVPLVRRGNRAFLSVSVDQHSLLALLDSGARSRILSRSTAEKLGVKSEALERDPGGSAYGVDGHRAFYHWHRFNSFTVGDETEKNVVLTVAPLSEDVDLLLGADWFVKHEILLSWSSGHLFFRSIESK